MTLLPKVVWFEGDPCPSLLTAEMDTLMSIDGLHGKGKLIVRLHMSPSQGGMVFVTAPAFEVKEIT